MSLKISVQLRKSPPKWRRFLYFLITFYQMFLYVSLSLSCDKINLTDKVENRKVRCTFVVNQQERQQSTSEKENIDSLITIPKDIEKVIKGEKTATRRMKRFADVGDIMTLKGKKFVVENVYEQALGEISDEDARKEGYENFEAYKESILSIHPGMPWVPTLKVWVHEFSPLEN